MEEDNIIVSFPLKIPELVNVDSCQGQLNFMSKLYDEFMSSLHNVFSQKFGGGKKRKHLKRKRQYIKTSSNKKQKSRKTRKRGGSFTRNQANTLLKIIFAFFYLKTVDLWKLPLDVMTTEDGGDEEKLRLQQLILYKKERRDYLRGDEVTGWTINKEPKSTKEIIHHIKQFSEFKFILNNQFGTCSLITNMFLNTIKLFEFEKIYKEIQEDEIIGVSKDLQQQTHVENITKNLNRSLRNKNTLEVLSSWAVINTKPTVSYKSTLQPMSENLENNIRNIDPTLGFIQEVKAKLIRLRQKLYGTTKNKNVLTAFTTKNHIAVIWLTEDDNVVIIDAESFLECGAICVYVENREKFKKQNTTFQVKPLREYIKKQISFQDKNEEVCIFNEALTTFTTSPFSDLDHPAFDLTTSSIYNAYKDLQ